MKTILKIIAILLAVSIVAGGFVLAVNKSLSVSSIGNQHLAINSANGQFTGQPILRLEGGDRNEVSTSRGLSDIFFMFIELTGITAIVLLIENLFGIMKNRKLHSPQR